MQHHLVHRQQLLRHGVDQLLGLVDGVEGRDWILPIRLRTWASDCWNCFSHCCGSPAIALQLLDAPVFSCSITCWRADERLAVPPVRRLYLTEGLGGASLLSGMMVDQLEGRADGSALSPPSLLSLKLENRKGVHATQWQET